MAINPDLLIAAPMLQDYIVDKVLGTPLAGGIVSLFVDTARQTYKNWYYQTGTPGAYTYIPLDNPLSLSSVGTIQDPNGNDVIPFYYPFEESDENTPEAYYITVYSVDSNGNPATLQFTRENFPFTPSNVSPTATSPTFRNYIINNTYWRNIGSLNATNVLNQIIAPSQHDGYTNGDIRFLKNVTGANDAIAFSLMTEQLDNDITPEFFLGFQCNGAQAGETQKCIQYPVSLHVKQLQNVTASLVIQAQNVAGNPNNYLDLYIYQFLGTGALSQPAPVLIKRIILNNDFQKFIVPFTFPDASTASLGAGGDDAYFIQVQYPLAVTCNINHTKPSIYLSDTVPDNDFDTYDQIGTVIDSPRTGDYRTSLNSFLPFGWVPANDGTIGNSSSSATSRANNDTWPLYNLIYTSVLDNWAPVSGGRTSPGNTTAAAYTDFTANKTITLTRNLGRVVAGLNPAFNTALVFTVAFGTSNTILNLTNPAGIILTTGTALQLTTTGGLPTGLSANTIYYVYNPTNSTTAIQLAANLINANAGSPLVTFSSNGSGTNSVVPALGIYMGESAHQMTLAELVAHTHTVPISLVPNILSSGGGHNDTNSSNTTTSSTGSSTPFNVLQPTTFGNVFFKL
jgi:hypothetical protein